MTQRATRADVASRAGVSKTTVTYVLGERYDITIPEGTRDRVRNAARQLGYHPHAAARALASGRTNTITVAFPVRIEPYYTRILQAFDRYTHQHGYNMIAASVGHLRFDNVRADLAALRDNMTDGLVLAYMPDAFIPYIAELLPSPKPIVAMGISDVPGIDCISIALEAGVVAALDHLLAGGPRRVAFFGPKSGDQESDAAHLAFAGNRDPREAVYRRAMAQAGRAAEVIAGDGSSRQASMAALHAYVGAHGCPDGLFCFNDELAISAHRALREMGYRIPQDIRLVGCDGIEEGEYLEPQLSTIAQPMDRMCALAWECMARRLADPSLPRQCATVGVELIVRKSSLLSKDLTNKDLTNAGN